MDTFSFNSMVVVVWWGGGGGCGGDGSSCYSLEMVWQWGWISVTDLRW